MTRFVASVARLVWIAVLSMLFLLPLGWVQVAPAHAKVQQIEEAPGQVVYQSRQKLYDRNNHTWQAIAFKRIRPEGGDDLKLRLVGFPGSVELAHPQPLAIELPSGRVLLAEDISTEPFTDEAPASNVGQYNLQPVVEELPERFQAVLVLPTENGGEVRLGISLLVIQEWQQLARQS